MRSNNPFAVIFQKIDNIRYAVVSLLVFSFIINLLSLLPTIYMLQLFERVMQSRSEATLLYLTVIALALTIVWTALESIRLSLLRRLAVHMDGTMAGPIFARLNRQTDNLPETARQMVLRDLHTVREFVASPLVVNTFDFVFVPLFVLIAFLFHPILGAALLLVMVLIGVLTMINQRLLGAATLQSIEAQGEAHQFSRAAMQAAEPVRVMGMLPAVTNRWRSLSDDALAWNDEATRRAAVTTETLRFLRHAYPLVMLGVGVLLFLEQLVGAGAIFAAQLLATRAVAPVDAVLSNARSYWMVSHSAERLEAVLGSAGREPVKITLPRPEGPLVVSRATLTPPSREAVVLNDVSFTVQAGRILGVVGPSGAGKSSLARMLVGAWRPRRGQVTLGGHDLAHYDQDALGPAIGYVPQDVVLLPGTAADNISRFDASPDMNAKLMRAVAIAGIADIIQGLPDGLSTDLGPDGHTLSGGQRQRIALARAVYGDPHLVVLDEPNANLDAVGEERLAVTLTQLREAGAIVVVVTHRLNMLSWCDDVLVMNAGAVHAFGKRDRILARLPGYSVPPQIGSSRSGAANDGGLAP